MADEINIGDRVEIFLKAETWGTDGWFAGTVVRIDPYTEHRSFYWVQLDEELTLPVRANRLISVLNPRNIRKI